MTSPVARTPSASAQPTTARGRRSVIAARISASVSRPVRARRSPIWLRFGKGPKFRWLAQSGTVQPPNCAQSESSVSAVTPAQNHAVTERRWLADHSAENSSQPQPSAAARSAVASKVIHGCGVCVPGSGTPSSPVSSLRHAGWGKSVAGRKATSAATSNKTEPHASHFPGSRRGGARRKKRPTAQSRTACPQGK